MVSKNISAVVLHIKTDSIKIINCSSTPVIVKHSMNYIDSHKSDLSMMKEMKVQLYHYSAILTTDNHICTTTPLITSDMDYGHILKRYVNNPWLNMNCNQFVI